MSYEQIVLGERYTINTMRLQGKSIPEIANEIGRHRTTIWRELKRNRRPNHGAYEPDRADAISRGRRSRSRRNTKFHEPHFNMVKYFLKLDWSPEQVSGFLKKNQALNISHETIYKYIWHDKANGGDLWTHLRQSSKKRRKRYNAYDSRGRLADKRNISERPEAAEERKEQGHWEIDTVHGRGSNHCIVTLVDRKCGHLLIGKLKDKTTVSLNERVAQLIARHPKKFKTITSDNGTEFHQYKEIEKKTGVIFYFANPHHSWERGSNENTNGLIRQYLPKTKSMEKLTQDECDEIASKINGRPRKRYNYNSPIEEFYGT